MTIGKVQICNMALSHVGAGRIEALTENSAEAVECNTWYDHARLETLEAYDWNFARKRLVLSAHSEDPPDGVWGFRYQYPTDCVRARYMENPTVVHQSIVRGVPTQLVEPDAIPFVVEMDDDGITKSILTDLDDATLVYTFDQKDTNAFSRAFITTLAYVVASYVAFPLTGKLNIKKEMNFLARLTLQNAAANNHNENVPRAPRESEFIRGRW